MKNIDYVIKKVAEKNGMDEKIVATAIKYHWRKDIKQELFTHDHSAMYLRHIGTIMFSMIRNRTAINKLIEKIKRIRKSNKFTDERKAFMDDYYLRQLRKLLIQRNLMAINYIEKGHALEDKRIRKAAARSTQESGGHN